LRQNIKIFSKVSDRTFFQRQLRFFRSGGDILLFVGIWLVVALFEGQDELVIRGSPSYWLAVGPALLFPALRWRQTIRSMLFGPARPITAFVALASGWSLVQGDLAQLPPLFLIAWVCGWACRPEAFLPIGPFFKLVLTFFAAAFVVSSIQTILIYTDVLEDRFPFLFPQTDFDWLMEEHIESIPIEQGDGTLVESIPIEQGDGTLVESIPIEQGDGTLVALPDQSRPGLSFNLWSVFPGLTAPAVSPTWRVAIVPNIATSAIFSLFVLMISLKCRLRPAFAVICAIFAVYLIIFGFVRASMTALVLAAVTVATLRLLPDRPVLNTLASLTLTLGCVALVWMSPHVLYLLQENETVSRVLLRGQSDLSLSEIYRQVYRPWLWNQHILLFTESSYLMGWGSEILQSAQDTMLTAGHKRSDSVSFLTRLLATYGIAAFGLFYFLLERCLHHARAHDTWALVMWGMIVWLMITWGSLFHPSNGLFVLAFMVMARGSAAIRFRPAS
jgi:hypothetical protein